MVSGKRILLVDPDIPSINYIAPIFKNAGYTVEVANSGKEGLVCAWRDRPHAIIIDPVFSDIAPKEFLLKLRRDNRTSKRKIIALSSLTKPDQIQDAINLDFDYYLPKEKDAVPALLDVVEKLLTGKPVKPLDPDLSDSQAMRAAKEEGKTIVFLSAKGGTGTSSICANMGYMLHLHHPEKKIVVADLVLPIGSIAPIVGYEGGPNLVNVSKMSGAEASPEYLNEALPYIEDWNFHLLAGSPNPTQASETDISRIPLHINTLKKINDYVLIDLGRSLSRISLPIITSADLIIIILSLDQATVTLTLRVLEYLRSKGVKSKCIYPLINRAVGLEGLPKKEVDKMLEIEITGNIPHIGGTFSMANNAHQPLPKRYPDDIVGIALREIVEGLVTRLDTKEAECDD